MAVASYPLVKRRDQGRTNQIRAPFFPFPFIPFLSFHMFLFSFLPSLFPRELVSPQGMSFNVPASTRSWPKANLGGGRRAQPGTRCYRKCPNQIKTEIRTIFFQPASFILLGTACKCKPSASIIFKTVESSGFPEGDSALYKLSLPSPVSAAILDILLARAISPSAAAIRAVSFSSNAASR